MLASSVSPVNALYYPQHSSPRLADQDQLLQQQQQQEADKFATESHDISDFVTYVCQDSASSTLENATFHTHPHQLAPHSHSLAHHHTSSHYHQIHQQLRGAKVPQGTPYHNTMLPPMLPPMARPVAIIRTSGDLSMVQSTDKESDINEETRNVTATIGGNNSPIGSDAADSIASSECTTLVTRTPPLPHTHGQNHPASSPQVQARCKMPTIASNSLARIATQMYPSANGREYFNHFHTQPTSVSIIFLDMILISKNKKP